MRYTMALRGDRFSKRVTEEVGVLTRFVVGLPNSRRSHQVVLERKQLMKAFPVNMAKFASQWRLAGREERR